ncbi:zinc finger protein [Macleaya cordata]|uniref:RBR-type E3 ubiquitin transferase n=1 Tax=Macleaya cordata TaxID=56857 RepID=A0A200Q955_MACCD|nr:zinc finger protein [Macleaya cordata]
MTEMGIKQVSNLEVDDVYFAVQSDEEEIFPISDEKYAEKLWFQEALMSSVLIASGSAVNGSSKNEEISNCHSNKKMKSIEAVDNGREAGESSKSFCGICMEGIPKDEMFMNTKCSHTFCSDCVSKHIAAKIQENNITVRCLQLKCKETLEPHMCRTIIPKQVFDRWGDAISESLILASQKIYCPFKDCSALLVNEGDEVIREAECPLCFRLFCAQCKVPWHSEIKCEDFQKLNKNERAQEDIMFMKLAKNKNWKRCPNCKIYVEKKDGCWHITCRCKFEFCYDCGSSWSTIHRFSQQFYEAGKKLHFKSTNLFEICTLKMLLHQARKHEGPGE